jgi:hypothetical protein
MTIAAIHRYPVKSMQGESLTHTVLDERGVVGDRAYALLDVETGIVASATVPKRWPTLLQFSAAFTAEPVPGEPAPPVTITFPDGSTRRSDEVAGRWACAGVYADVTAGGELSVGDGHA